MKLRQRSLKRPLIVQPLLVNLAILLASFTVIVALLLRFDHGGGVSDETVAGVVAHAVDRRADDSLRLNMTDELVKLRTDVPDLWFVVEDDEGRNISYGEVPKAFASFRGELRKMSYAQVRAHTPPYEMSAVIARETGPAGPLIVLAHGNTSPLTVIVALASNFLVIPIFLMLALASLIMTPLIVRRALAGVAKIADEARQIETDRRGLRLSEEYAPLEIAPLVKAVNDGLQRLDEGYLRQKRFIAAAAHELRTPIAILRVKLDAADDETSRKLNGDVARLANLAEQLLDLHRIDDEEISAPVALDALVEHAVADIAPLVIAAEKSVEVLVEDAESVLGSWEAMERVVINLVLNAVQHGGQHVIIRVQGASFQVEDDGPGIPREARDRLFEPFERLRPQSTGTGLGLYLVHQVVERCHGRVFFVDASGCGTIVRVEFPRP